jgi:hypothetical protein
VRMPRNYHPTNKNTLAAHVTKLEVLQTVVVAKIDALVCHVT